MQPGPAQAEYGGRLCGGFAVPGFPGPEPLGEGVADESDGEVPGSSVGAMRRGGPPRSPGSKSEPGSSDAFAELDSPPNSVIAETTSARTASTTHPASMIFPVREKRDTRPEIVSRVTQNPPWDPSFTTSPPPDVLSGHCRYRTVRIPCHT